MVRTRSAAERAAEQDVERRPSLVDDAYAKMKEEILESRFPPGFQASEQEIALRLGMSRTPVHEAAIRLQEDGLIRVLSRRGILILALAPEDMREIYDVIIAIEGRAAELLASLPDVEREAVAAELAGHTAAMADAKQIGDLPGWARADEAFHRTLVERARNERMVRIIQTINDQSHRARMLTLRLRRELGASVAEHQQIIDAIRFGDPAKALDRAHHHRLRARDELLPLLESFGLKHL
ncbi:GntR family transcriptional regulator [Methylobacterium planeticum]|uniref:GntR family transcriptional regulator n=1 Tax=Methylobacterium planeticum TaxID=2615211 RepID=A0A6N6MH60_9HYPH|nr:GntR family transcriptional regulator [Methylobacterium planeticum]KAB1069214.1 GntR family transcriptional regulator [Methylobacterium planeticum]